jgi:hypothetical protein
MHMCKAKEFHIHTLHLSGCHIIELLNTLPHYVKIRFCISSQECIVMGHVKSIHFKDLELYEVAELLIC